MRLHHSFLLSFAALFIPAGAWSAELRHDFRHSGFDNDGAETRG